MDQTILSYLWFRGDDGPYRVAFRGNRQGVIAERESDGAILGGINSDGAVELTGYPLRDFEARALIESLHWHIKDEKRQGHAVYKSA
ncbi:hypothetical protein Lfu02_55150 [Longispora fulva]|uniref:Uncharacterized protein n=1 Tax=Longispora fulva TaxID=619741 RepID=A0A8J7GRR4_9ACTN|nr:hypothetical protein [Longispora fulva]GIG61143.1 hypothetical protein Lfu02_55150 [Longispora fulva]